MFPGIHGRSLFCFSTLLNIEWHFLLITSWDESHLVFNISQSTSYFRAFLWLYFEPLSAIGEDVWPGPTPINSSSEKNIRVTSSQPKPLVEK